MEPTILIPLLGVILAPLLTYLVARRRSSGKVDTTEAATLWVEAGKMREEYRTEAESCRVEAEQLRVEQALLREEMAAMRQEAIVLRAEATAWHAEAVELRKLLAEERRKSHERDE